MINYLMQSPNYHWVLVIGPTFFTVLASHFVSPVIDSYSVTVSTSFSCEFFICCRMDFIWRLRLWKWFWHLFLWQIVCFLFAFEKNNSLQMLQWYWTLSTPGLLSFQIFHFSEFLVDLHGPQNLLVPSISMSVLHITHLPIIPCSPF